MVFQYFVESKSTPSQEGEQQVHVPEASSTTFETGMLGKDNEDANSMDKDHSALDEESVKDTVDTEHRHNPGNTYYLNRKDYYYYRLYGTKW